MAVVGELGWILCFNSRGEDDDEDEDEDEEGESK